MAVIGMSQTLDGMDGWPETLGRNFMRYFFSATLGLLKLSRTAMMPESRHWARVRGASSSCDSQRSHLKSTQAQQLGPIACATSLTLTSSRQSFLASQGGCSWTIGLRIRAPRP
jgi:hypothetical protein